VNPASHEGLNYPKGEIIMKQNLGLFDRGIRLLAAIVIAALYFAGQITGTAAIILGIFAAVFVLTGVFAFCPLYVPLKFSSSGKKGE
jgi:hypothetical protein